MISDKRTIVIGDVHGCFKELLALLDLANYNQDRDVIIFTGDLINRGPYSKECFDFLLTHNASSVMGNHEYYLLQAYDQKKYTWDVYQNMRRQFGDLFPDLIATIRTWPLWLEYSDYLIIHAGFNPALPLEKSNAEFLTNVRKIKDAQGYLTPWFDLYHGDKTVLFGHWAKLGGVIRKNVIGLDMGCVYGKKLRAIVLPSKEIIEVDAEKNYYPIKQKYPRPNISG